LAPLHRHRLLAGRLTVWGQRRVLPVLAVAFAGALVVLVLASARLAPVGLGALAAVAGLARPPVEAALRAMWPRIVPGGQVDAAYALDSTVQELIWIAGPLLLAVLLATGSPQLPLFACAILSIGGTVLYTLGLRDVPGGQAGASSAPSPLRRAGLRILLVCAACYGVAAGILGLALVAFAGHTAAWPGPGFWSRSGDWAAWPAASCMAAGSGAVRSRSASSTEAFAWTFAAVTVAMAGGSAFAGMIIQGAGVNAAFLAAGGIGLVGAAFGALRLPAHQQAAR
jgi:hypothetical protein